MTPFFGGGGEMFRFIIRGSGSMEDDGWKEQGNVPDDESVENVEMNFLIDRVLVSSTPFEEDGAVILLMFSLG
eukprot:CAMPEP_0198266518 /NCGR_PEP_ID=MMETSP1447-20131203/28671_1 /TAXON_ID=420782 /ORGANISM="Chaetoceros dichaeta, Strain CCMP1751" /LENGTH=72 /DNA_ID=CAMNT_0043956631 /DNA_START=241 /DNA_END=459 /DNA_ORIENTATION=-